MRVCPAGASGEEGFEGTEEKKEYRTDGGGGFVQCIAGASTHTTEGKKVRICKSHVRASTLQPTKKEEEDLLIVVAALLDFAGEINGFDGIFSKIMRNDEFNQTRGGARGGSNETAKS